MYEADWVDLNARGGAEVCAVIYDAMGRSKRARRN